jgi:hypothetical protein
MPRSDHPPLALLIACFREATGLCSSCRGNS